MDRNLGQFNTLPRNFVFHFTDDTPPREAERTPVQNHHHEPVMPDAPIVVSTRPAQYRVRRRTRSRIPSSTFQSETDNFSTADVPLPSIEPLAHLAQPQPETTMRPQFRVPSIQVQPAQGEQPLRPINTRLSSLLNLQRAWQSEKTPERQMASTPEPLTPLAMPASINSAMSMARPTSAMSAVSDSSDESDTSSLDSRSHQDSCTTPESDIHSPFSAAKVFRPSLLSASYKRPGSSDEPPTKKLKTRWTAEMDTHLWNVYMMYLQDPRFTPFKMHPGSIPPLGVCRRVAREAGKLWRSQPSTSRLSSPALSRVSRMFVERRLTPSRNLMSPVEIEAPYTRSARPQWPKTSIARRRLKHLCKRKTSIAPHYQRLLASRSPSPFTSSSPQLPSRRTRTNRSSELSSEIDSFSTRDVHVTLTTSTSETMQPDGPLARLSRPSPAPSPFARSSVLDDPYFPRASSAAPENTTGDLPPLPFRQSTFTPGPPLGSPFAYSKTWGPSRSSAGNSRPSLGHLRSSPALPSPLPLGSPFNMRKTLPHPQTQKRRAFSTLDEDTPPATATSHSQDIAVSPKDSITLPPLPTRTSNIPPLASATNLGRFSLGPVPPRRGRRGFSLGADVDANSSFAAQTTHLYTPHLEHGHGHVRPALQDLFERPLDQSGSGSQPFNLASRTLTLNDPFTGPSNNTSSFLAPGTTVPPRLASPFAGISTRPKKTRGHHFASASLSHVDNLHALRANEADAAAQRDAEWKTLISNGGFSLNRNTNAINGSGTENGNKRSTNGH